MKIFPDYKHPLMSAARAAIEPDKLERLKLASELALSTLEKLPLDIARAYVKQLNQLYDLIERIERIERIEKGKT